MFVAIIQLTDNSRPRPIHVILLMTILLLDHDTDKSNKLVSGQAIIPFLQPADIGNGSVLRSFLDPCEVVTLQTQCTEEEYETNEDCLPQKKDNCDRSKELFCLSGVCLPNCHPYKENYDHAEGKCFRKVGSDCRSFNASTSPISTTAKTTQLPLFQDGNAVNDEQETDQQHSTVIVPECEKNAVCEKGQCRCAKNFTYDHNFSRCMLSANYASYCNETITCDRKSDIVCKENQCQCKSPEIQYIHLKRKRCYIMIGQVCSTGLQFCPDNSNCVRNRAKEADNNIGNNDILLFTPSTPPHHSRNSTQEDKYHRLRLLYEEHQSVHNSDGTADNMEDEHFIGIWEEDEEEKEFICKCNKGYGSTRDKRFCLGLHGTRCNTLHRCNLERGLKCVDGFCLCGREKANEQIFSEQYQTCITRPGAACIDDGKGEREADICPIGGSCKQEKCTCDKGLTPASSSTTPSTASIAYSCMKSHGTACKNATGEDIISMLLKLTDLFETPCNHEIGLECNAKEGKCLCRDSNQFYDVRLKTCRTFHATDGKIPVIHFTPPEDREYNFRRNSGSSSSAVVGNVDGFIFILFLYLVYVSLL